MIIMAENDSGVMFMSEAPKSHNGGPIIMDSAMTSDEIDSESEGISLMSARSYLSSAETKRNKRKNFQPRNIAYSETESITESFTNRDRTPSNSSESDYALDLSNVDVLRGTSSGGCTNVDEDAGKPTKDDNDGAGAQNAKDDDEAEQTVNESSPIDLSCSKSTSPYPYNHVNSYYSDSDSGDEPVINVKTEEKRRKEILESFKTPAGPYFLHPLLGHGGDASDLKEYFQNTVKELLGIYGVNTDVATDVAQTINNVPISNFSSGKILESQIRHNPKSEPPTPPRSPQTHSLKGLAMTLNPIGTPSSKKADLSFSKQTNVRTQSSIFSSSDTILPQNVAAILALSSMKDQQPKTNSMNDGKPCVTITPSRLSPSLHTENSNNSNSDSLTIRRVSSVSPLPLLKENRPQTIQRPLQSVSSHPTDYSRYVKRFSTAMECGNNYCKDLNYREHFHCLDCNSKVFIKKEEMIRHFKWHKKRDESLQHGFMRYSSSDDCTDRFQNCTHNRKQTHYHCIQGTCDKVYISTSDVQMHANYHRKDSAIIQEGFQRLRATEECRTEYCVFFGQKTTHFHCRREHCTFTFKNKADMEKHKTYHIKDEQLARDGFRKFLKQDPCGFTGCRFSQICNHIHCVREGCSYVLHSSGQLVSHKRKHERKDNEMTYRKFKLNHQNLSVFNGAADQLSQYSDKLLSPTNSLPLFQHSQVNPTLNTSYAALHENSYSNSSSEDPASPANSIKFRSSGSTQLSGGYFTENFSPMDFSQSEDSSDYFYRFINYFQVGDSCPLNVKCSMHGTEHYHCKEPNCELSFKSKDSAESHARLHEAQERLAENLYQEGTPYCHEDSCPKEKHFHCTWDGCYEAILPSEKLEHLKIHEISTNQFNSLDALFRRKRGRPPKNRIIEVWNDCSGIIGNDSPQAIFTSFKLPKISSGTITNNSQQSDNEINSPPNNHSPKHLSQHILDQYKFEEYTEGCPDPLCVFSNRSPTSPHYHCRRPRCFFATNSEEQLLSHSVNFHDTIEIMDGFLFFDSSVDCRLDNCKSNKINRHFHCVRPGCGFSFVGYSVMAEHNNKHQLSEITHKINSSKDGEPEIKCEPSDDSVSLNNSATNITPTSAPSLSPVNLNSKSNVVRAAGTFYPLCSLNNVGNSSPPSISEDKIKLESPSQQDSLSVIPTSTPTPTTTSSPLLNLLPERMQLHEHTNYTADKPCCRPFCKLKRKEHYHCNECNQAFSEVDKLKQHILKLHNPSKKPFAVKLENNNNNSMIDDNEDLGRSPAGLPPSLPMGIDAADLVHSPHYPGLGVAMAAAQQLAMMTSQSISFIGMPPLYTSPSGFMITPPHAFTHPHALLGNNLLESVSPHGADLSVNPTNSEMNAAQKRCSASPHEMSPEMKKARIQNSMRILKDEPVPEGYLRFRFNEDCHYSHCGYREHQTHFHCVRQDCGYSFCDKTRFVQHTARHERLDTLMGGDFHQYRANVSCGRVECAYTASLSGSQNKASHFHCLKCDFVCTDTNKVVAHRRQHQKLDSINAAGFEKFTPSQACNQPDTCVHSGKQTHYHCLSCQYAVLGLSQMTSHKYRHMDQ
ncbi:zinc finger protein castor homolog 1-like isoform X2 [Planococcus citri]|uniref:zinc finger protein castor homolog 1-like isoform X2 n=1 Tax=Planococcus citri TaxID=170843 RepID=UPI0031F90C35